MPGRGSDRGAAALERRDPFFEHGDGRVGQPRIDVAEIVQVEERSGVIDIVEDIGRGLIDRGRTRAGRRIGRGAGMDRPGLEAIFEVVRRRRALLRPPRQRRRWGAIADDAAVDAAPRQFAAEPPELDFRASVHDHFDPCGLRRPGRRVVADAELHPHHLGADRDRVGDDAGRLIRRPEYVDHVDLVGNVAERSVGLLAEQRLAGDRGIDRDHAVAFALQVLHHEVARPVPVRRRADHCDRFYPLKDRADFGVGIGNGLEIGHAARSGCESARILACGEDAATAFSPKAHLGLHSTASPTILPRAAT